VQALHLQSAAKVRDLAPGEAPARMSISLEPGKETVAWLYHFEDDGTELKDEESAYTIAVTLREFKTGRFEFPSEGASVTFFCDNWGRGFKAAEARATRGSLDVREAGPRGVGGDFDVTLEGYKERPDRTREGITLYLQGAFQAVR
jgi:hypothetical protein